MSSLRQPDVPATALELFGHILAAELVWLDRIEGEPPSIAVWPDADQSRCADLASQAHGRYARFLDGLDVRGLRRVVVYENSRGQRFENRVQDILLHVGLHGQYHRGQVAAQIRSAGGIPESTDYIAYVRGAPAATRDPSS